MFDNPNEELKRLEEQLLQAEETDREFDRFFGDLYEEFGPVEEPAYEEETYGVDTAVSREMENLLVETPADSGIRNYVNGYGRDGQVRRNPGSAQQRPVQQRAAQPRTAPQNAGRTTGESRYAAPVQKAKGVKGLVITACIECAGIVGVVLWWVLRIL